MSSSVFGNSQSRSRPSKPYFLAALMEELMKASRLSGVRAIMAKVSGPVAAPPMDRKTFARGVLA